MTPVRASAAAQPRRAIAICLLLWSLGGPGAGVRAETATATPTIEQLEAALLMTFANFTVWPAGAFSSPSSPVVVGVIEDEAVQQAFEALSRGRNVGGRPIAPKRLRWDSDMTGVHVLFLGHVEPRHVTVLLAQLQRRQILTVSMLPEFVQGGGMIALKSAGGRVSFAVNSRATELSGLQLSSFLLSHATKVSSEGP